MSPDPVTPVSPEIQLIQESVLQASARIRLFRVAFGRAGQGQQMSRAEMQGLLDDLARGGRLSFRHDGLTDIDRASAKLMFLALLCLESALPWGGQIALTQWPDGQVRLSGQVPRIKALPQLWAILTDGQPHADLSPGEVHFALLAQELRAQGRHALITSSPEDVAVLIQPRPMGD